MRATILAAAALVLLTGTAPAAAAKPKPRNCNPKGSVTLAASAQGRVYRRGETVFACSYRTRKRARLGRASRCPNPKRTSDFRFGRGVLGFVEAACDLGTSDENIRVINLRSGRTLFRYAAFDTSGDRGGDRPTQVSDWAMKPNGSVAAIGRLTITGTPEYQVWKAEVGPEIAQISIDRGYDIDPSSLAVGMRSGAAPIYWRKGGTIFSATLR